MPVKEQGFRLNRRGKALAFALAFVALILLLIFTAGFGSSELKFRESLLLLLERLFKLDIAELRELPDTYRTILFRVRLPRIALAALTGAALSMVGATYQTLFLNPLADPHILGVSSGAGLGAAVGIVLGIPVSGYALSAIGIFAFLGGLLAMGLLFLLSGRTLKTETGKILLAGVALSSLFSAIMSFMMMMSHEKLTQIYYWTMGSFNGATWDKVIFMTCVTVPIGLILQYHTADLNILLAGDEEAHALGVPTGRIRKRLILLATFLVAATVATAGIVSFIGLVVPHALRLMRIRNLKTLLPASALLGAAFTALCDLFARMILAPSEIPVGIITAFFGVPLFLSLLYRSGRRMM